MEERETRPSISKSNNSQSLFPFPPPPLFQFNIIYYSKGGRGLIGLYDGSLHEALKDTFPEYNFDFDCKYIHARFTRRHTYTQQHSLHSLAYPREHWLPLEHRKQFFSDLAKDYQLDMSRPDLWNLHITRSEIKARKVPPHLSLTYTLAGTPLNTTFCFKKGRRYPIGIVWLAPACYQTNLS